jgi:hypothetical protein
MYSKFNHGSTGTVFASRSYYSRSIIVISTPWCNIEKIVILCPIESANKPKYFYDELPAGSPEVVTSSTPQMISFAPFMLSIDSHFFMLEIHFQAGLKPSALCKAAKCLNK